MMKARIYRGVDNHFRLLKKERGERTDISLEALSDWDAFEIAAQLIHRHKLDEWDLQSYVHGKDFTPV